MFISDKQFDVAVSQLSEFVAIPTVSDPNSPDHNMDSMVKAASFARDKLSELGFEVRCPRIDGSAPYVLAQRISHPDKPTVLLYAHYDVQPVDRDHWKSDPFKLEVRDGRLYGRGASDDKGGVIAILAALNVYQEKGRELPVNVKILFEGEEEYNSTHMKSLLEQEAERLSAHALVVLDGMNRSVQTGSLSSSTRGLINLEVRVDALQQSIHSGLACLAPDPAQALSGLIYSLRDPRQIPGFMDGRLPLGEEERKLLREGSIDAKTYAKEVGALGGETTLRGDPSYSIYERIATETPCISVINMNSGQPNGGNSIQESARCTLNIRVLPGQDPDRVGQSVIKYLQSQTILFNLRATIQKLEGSFAWKADLSSPFSKKYLEALGQHFPEVCALPCGGTLPLFRVFENAFPKMEMLLPGVEDPHTAAHSHNESQDSSVLRNSINSLISFLNLAGTQRE